MDRRNDPKMSAINKTKEKSIDCILFHKEPQCSKSNFLSQKARQIVVISSTKKSKFSATYMGQLSMTALTNLKHPSVSRISMANKQLGRKSE